MVSPGFGNNRTNSQRVIYGAHAVEANIETAKTNIQMEIILSTCSKLTYSELPNNLRLSGRVLQRSAPTAS